jgi:Tfp pilus assembly protein PilN
VRPINLIPDDERRRSAGVATRTGPVAYLLVGVLGVLLIGVVMLVLFNNSIHTSEGEVARLESEKAVATAQASKLARYTDFNQVTEQRRRTISELADSRFDWARVIRQLSLVLSRNIYLDKLTASGGGSGAGSEAGVKGPSLNLIGCGFNQPAVGSFISALKQIDGVTRIELNKSAVTVTESSGSGGTGPCAKSGMAQFEMLVAFDAAPPSPDSTTAITEEGETAESEGSTESEGSSESEGEGSDSESSSESSGSESSEGSSGQSAVAPTSGAAG